VNSTLFFGQFLRETVAISGKCLLTTTLILIAEAKKDSDFLPRFLG
jgi:hypothetical protein